MSGRRLTAASVALAFTLAAPAPVVPSPPRPAAGRLLVATQQVGGFFRESVVLLLKADDSGAIGLIVNRPTRMKISAAIPKAEVAPARDRLWFGGPVEPSKVFVLVDAERPPAGGTTVVRTIQAVPFDSAREFLAGRRGKAESVRVYAGYAGWAPGQLENEIDRGDWQLRSADPRWVFDPKPETVWQRLRSVESASGACAAENDAA